MPRTLKINQSVWSKVFRAIVSQVEGDADIRRVVGIENVFSWSGKPGDSSPFSPTGGVPLVRLTPNPGNVDWYDPTSQAGTLSVAVEIAVPGTVVDECMDLYDLLVIALRPENQTFCDLLVSLGAETGEIVFDSPAYDPNPAAQPQGYFSAKGSFRLKLLRSVNI